MSDILKDMLLIDTNGSAKRLYTELNFITKLFLGPSFIIAVIFEGFGESDYMKLIKKIILISLFLGCFYQIHTTGVKLSFKASEALIKRTSPNNLFLKKWAQRKIETKSKNSWGFLERIAIPNLNDVLATLFFLLSKVFTWLLKLIFTSVYHLTYIFSGITALMYLFNITSRSIVGTIQSSIWCMIMPFVVASIIALVGNTIETSATNGELMIANIETILWLFGVTLLLLISPVITLGMVRGDGISYAGAQMGSLSSSAMMRVYSFLPKMLSPLRNLKRIGRLR